jgi:hypothetical protein
VGMYGPLNSATGTGSAVIGGDENTVRG